MITRLQQYDDRAQYRLAEHLTELAQSGAINSSNQHYRNLMARVNEQKETTVEFEKAVTDNQKILSADGADADRKTLNSIIDEYTRLKTEDRDDTAERRHELRDEVGKRSSLMGPAEQSAWYDLVGGPHETRAEYEAEEAAERVLGEAAIEGLARGEQVSDGEQSFLPLDWKQRVDERREEIRNDERKRDQTVNVEAAAKAAEDAAQALVAQRNAQKDHARRDEEAAQQHHGGQQDGGLGLRL